MLYALLMAAVFSLLLQFYLNRQTAHQRNLLAQQERQEAYAIALLTKDQKLADSGQFSFNKGQRQYQKEKGQLVVNVVISDRTYDFTFAIKEPSVRLDKDQDKDKKSELEKEEKKEAEPAREKEEAKDDDGKKD